MQEIIINFINSIICLTQIWNKQALQLVPPRLSLTLSRNSSSSSRDLHPGWATCNHKIKRNRQHRRQIILTSAPPIIWWAFGWTETLTKAAATQSKRTNQHPSYPTWPSGNAANWCEKKQFKITMITQQVIQTLLKQELLLLLLLPELEV